MRSRVAGGVLRSGHMRRGRRKRLLTGGAGVVVERCLRLKPEGAVEGAVEVVGCEVQGCGSARVGLGQDSREVLMRDAMARANSVSLPVDGVAPAGVRSAH